MPIPFTKSLRIRILCLDHLSITDLLNIYIDLRVGADMEVDVYTREDYGGYWRRNFANSLDGLFLSIAFAMVSFAPVGAITILEILIFLTYMIWFKLTYGATPGYQLLGIKIVSIDGAELSLKQIVIRLISTFFSALLLGLGYLWIVFDENRQAWHDKTAGTYVIRPGAIPIHRVKSPYPSLIRTKLLVSLASISIVVFVGIFGAVWSTIKNSEPYKLSVRYIKTNPWVQEEVGNPVKIGWLLSGNFSTTGDSGEADFAMRVSGKKGKTTVAVVVEKRRGQWELIKAGYRDKNGRYINITQLYSTADMRDVLRYGPNTGQEGNGSHQSTHPVSLEEELDKLSERIGKKKKKPLPKLAAKETYRPISFQDAKNYKGRWVKILMKDGLVREGKILDVEGDVIKLEQSFTSGSFSIRLSNQKIEKILLHLLAS